MSELKKIAESRVEFLKELEKLLEKGEGQSLARKIRTERVMMEHVPSRIRSQRYPRPKKMDSSSFSYKVILYAGTAKHSRVITRYFQTPSQILFFLKETMNREGLAYVPSYTGDILKRTDEGFQRTSGLKVHMGELKSLREGKIEDLDLLTELQKMETKETKRSKSPEKRGKKKKKENSPQDLISKVEKENPELAKQLKSLL